MFWYPISLTATVHVRFNYADKEPGVERSHESQVELKAKILDRASELPPDLQALLVKFIDFLNHLGQEGER